jgi:hypothetical protein
VVLSACLLQVEEERFRVVAVRWLTIEDMDHPDGYRELVADYVVSSLDHLPAGQQPEWSLASEVRSWVRAMPGAAVFRSLAALPAAAAEFPVAALPGAATTHPSTKKRKAPGVKAKPAGKPNTRAHAHRLESRGAQRAAAPRADQDLSTDIDGSGSGGGSIGSSSGSGTKQSGKLGFVFSRIVAVVRGDGTPTRYTCEYHTETGVQLLSHTRDQVSDAAVADFKQKVKSKLFKYSKEEQRQRADMCGNNDKEFQEILRRRAQSAGVGAGITNCGVIVDLYELFGAESASQVTADAYEIVPTNSTGSETGHTATIIFANHHCLVLGRCG